MQTLILCGGKGTRAYPYTDHIPKPMLPLHGQPILVHVMKIYAEQGHREFILSLGHRKEVIKDYFEDRFPKWKIHLVDTGADADTGQRIERCKELLKDDFFVTYADGIGNIDLSKLTAFHKSHGGCATLTSVQLPSQYGTIELGPAGNVAEFKEKPVIKDYWINAGFFVLNEKVFKHWHGTNFERHVLPHLGKLHLLYAYRHSGFWKSMDTYKDHQELENILSEDRHICNIKRNGTHKIISGRELQGWAT